MLVRGFFGAGSGVLLLGTSSSGMISLLLDLLLDILNEMLSLTLKSILPTPIECGNIENQIGIHLISITKD